jgi:membrane-associated protein
VRTFVPFVAGAAAMTASTFVFYNVIGGIIWVTVCAGAGYLFGNVPIIKNNFGIVTIAIIVISVLPVVWGVLKPTPAPTNG